jgi:hypothetical protein
MQQSTENVKVVQEQNLNALASQIEVMSRKIDNIEKTTLTKLEKLEKSLATTDSTVLRLSQLVQRSADTMKFNTDSERISDLYRTICALTTAILYSRFCGNIDIPKVAYYGIGVGMSYAGAYIIPPILMKCNDAVKYSIKGGNSLSAAVIRAIKTKLQKQSQSDNSHQAYVQSSASLNIKEKTL